MQVADARVLVVSVSKFLLVCLASLILQCAVQDSAVTRDPPNPPNQRVDVPTRFSVFRPQPDCHVDQSKLPVMRPGETGGFVTHSVA
jgi:hypothetical protein